MHITHTPWQAAGFDETGDGVCELLEATFRCSAHLAYLVTVSVPINDGDDYLFDVKRDESWCTDGIASSLASVSAQVEEWILDFG